MRCFPPSLPVNFRIRRLVLYIAAAVCLPEVREGAGEVNMRPLVFLGPYVVMMFARWRWLNVSLLAAILIYFSIITMGYRLSG
jgi:hypothetical protein